MILKKEFFVLTCRPERQLRLIHSQCQQNVRFPQAQVNTGSPCMLSTILRQWFFHTHQTPSDRTLSPFLWAIRVRTNMMSCHRAVARIVRIVQVKIIPLNRLFPVPCHSPMAHCIWDLSDHHSPAQSIFIHRKYKHNQFKLAAAVMHMQINCGRFEHITDNLGCQL